MGEEKRFRGVVRSVTLGREDMARLLAMPFAEIDDWSPVRVIVYPDWPAALQALAESMVGVVRENNRLGRPTSFIVPVGPTGQYPIAAALSNRERLSWRDVWLFNMDEYLDWQGRPIPEDHPMSFRAAMRREFYDRLDEELRPPEVQRWFPDPFDPEATERKIDEVTGGEGVDVCYGGVGEHGHLAFNEAPGLLAHYAHLTPEEFKASRTRALPLNPETLSRAFSSPLYTLSPPGAVTLGLRVVLGAKRIELATFGVRLKLAAMHPPSLDFPATFIQEHADPKRTVIIHGAAERT
ncbi:MAG: sugar phosphate isomerase family [Chloroflexota bacterium]